MIVRCGHAGLEEQAFYLVENYEVKNLVVNVSSGQRERLQHRARPSVLRHAPENHRENAGAFLSKYSFMDPRHGLDKLKALRKDTHSPRPSM